MSEVHLANQLAGWMRRHGGGDVVAEWTRRLVLGLLALLLPRTFLPQPQAGMRWAEENLNPMLALRMALCNDTWQTSWQEIVAHVRREKYTVRSPHEALSSCAQSSQQVTEADCERLTVLADKLVKKRRHQWRDHRWLFPYRENLIHKN